MRWSRRFVSRKSYTGKQTAARPEVPLWRLQVNIAAVPSGTERRNATSFEPIATVCPTTGVDLRHACCALSTQCLSKCADSAKIVAFAKVGAESDDGALSPHHGASSATQPISVQANMPCSHEHVLHELEPVSEPDHPLGTLVPSSKEQSGAGPQAIIVHKSRLFPWHPQVLHQFEPVSEPDHP
mmetsp:Transcript_31401/g.57681  ORF Transcript_31401/g.57681 Transcript_31401/m.57681 type:complete len:184 (-) Transcript_31401:297-848(-)